MILFHQKFKSTMLIFFKKIQKQDGTNQWRYNTVTKKKKKTRTTILPQREYVPEILTDSTFMLEDDSRE
jgi:hypothetical protein